MKGKLRPWGDIKWLLPKTGVGNWHVITSSSFEDRCTSLVDFLLRTNIEIQSSNLIKIVNPSSHNWNKAKVKVDENYKKLCSSLECGEIDKIEIKLLDPASDVFSRSKINGINNESVILDITTLPKRFFLFAFKQLVSNENVKNLVLTYSHANIYPEESLCEDAQPLSPLQGYVFTGPLKTKQRLIVDVGYVPLSVESVLEQAKQNKLDFIFPFPPASPGYRRNWKLLSMLMPDDLPRDTEIHRIHGLDAFEICDRLIAKGKVDSLKMLPLGPKPHALGMAMAYIRLEDQAEIIYSQPLSYRSNYSEGIALDLHGNPKITAYCLKKDGKQLF